MNNNDVLKDIYRQSFGSEPDFENPLFKNCRDYIDFLEIENTPVSMLFSLPCEIYRGNERYEFIYIFAAATHPDYRKKGYMEQLLKKVQKKYNKPILLRPANENLINYYKKFGFTTHTAQDNQQGELYLTPTGGFKKLSDNCEASADGTFAIMSYRSPLSLDGLYFPYTMP